MPCTESPEITLAVTISGTTITVSSTTNVWPGQIGWISRSGQTTRRVKVVSVLSGTTFTAKYEPRIGDDNFAKNSQAGASPTSDAGYPGSSTCNDLSAYTLGSYYAEAQVVATLPDYTKPVS